MAKLFGTTGIRGLVNELLTPEFCSKIAGAFGTYIGGKGKKVLIAMDPRTSSEMIKDSVISGLLSAGCDVYDSGIAPTPAVQYSVRKLDFDAGIMVTGSHIPPERNGLKFFVSDGTEVYGPLEEEIEKIFFGDKIKRAAWTQIGKVHRFDCVEPYKKMLLDAGIRNENKNFKIVLDPGHGAQCAIASYVLRELGYDVLTINAQPDGFFPGRHSEPDQKNLKNLIEIIKTMGADIGVGIDGDGDRTIFVDDCGNFIMGDVTGCIIADDLMKKGDAVVTPVSTSSLIDWVGEKNKGKVIKTKVGAADVVAELLKNDAVFAFEENGGNIFAKINLCRDGGLTAVYMLNILAKRKKKLSEIVSEFPKYYQLKDKIKCADELKSKLTKKVKEIYADKKIVDIDGVKILFEDSSWILLRPSGTEPIFRIFVEAKTGERARKLMDEGLKTVNEAVSGLMAIKP